MPDTQLLFCVAASTQIIKEDKVIYKQILTYLTPF